MSSADETLEKIRKTVGNDGIDDIDGLSAPEPDTNIVVVDSGPAAVPSETLVDRLAGRGVRVGEFDEFTTRLCTHRDVGRDKVATAIDHIADAVRSATI